MTSLYASLTGTTVLQQKIIPSDALNHTPYEKRGWCVVEAGVAKFAEVHVSRLLCSMQGYSAGELNVVQRAQKIRHKLIDIRAPKAPSRDTKAPSRYTAFALVDSKELLLKTKKDLDEANFTNGKSEHEKVEQQLVDFHKKMEQAVNLLDDATSSMREAIEKHISPILILNIDDPLRGRLADGTIRLLRVDWLISTAANLDLGRAVNGSCIFRRRQELPDSAFVPEREAEFMLNRGTRSVLVLSHAWQSRVHPDPQGTTLAALRHYLMIDQTTARCGIFIECVPSPTRTARPVAWNLHPRTAYDRSLVS